jgi:putative PIN family toxin of toxin-antitoxin system
MPNKRDRVILDTNLWISFLITKNYSKLDKLIFAGNCVLLFSKELIEEFISVANRPKFRKYFSPTDIEDILEAIDEYAEFVNVKSATTICRDPKDNFLLSLSIDGQADYLLTGDNDLLVLKKINKTKIITIAEFFENR